MNREGRAGSPLPAALPRLPESEPPKAGAQRSARPLREPRTIGCDSDMECGGKPSCWPTEVPSKQIENLEEVPSLSPG